MGYKRYVLHEMVTHFVLWLARSNHVKHLDSWWANDVGKLSKRVNVARNEDLGFVKPGQQVSRAVFHWGMADEDEFAGVVEDGVGSHWHDVEIIYHASASSRQQKVLGQVEGSSM